MEAFQEVAKKLGICPHCGDEIEPGFNQVEGDLLSYCAQHEFYNNLKRKIDGWVDRYKTKNNLP